MRFLLLNQTFYPDVMATGQYLSEVARGLVERGHEVEVITSRRAYDDPQTRFPDKELWQGVIVQRVAGTGFGKSARWRRALDFLTFFGGACARLLIVRKPDVVLALTTPPLVSFIGAVFARIRGSRFHYWVMDFNPDEAIAAGYLRPHSFVAVILEQMSRYSLKQAAKVIALDRFMRDRIIAKEVAPRKVLVIPPWSQDGRVQFDPEGRDRFRRAHGLGDKFVVMYSGNHSPVHPLETILRAAKRFEGDANVAFVFVGGGSEWRRIRDEASYGHLPIKCIPYQPLECLSGSLSAADAHVVVMGEAMLGLVHPCKIYNILRLGTPVIYIGPEPSHVTEILDDLRSRGTRVPCASVRHGEAEKVVQAILNLRGAPRQGFTRLNAAAGFSQDSVMPRLLDCLSGK